MNRSSACFVGILTVALVAMTWFAAPSLSPQAQAQGGPAGNAPFAGTFLLEANTGIGIPEFDPLMGFVMLHNDGTMLFSLQNDFGWGGLHHLDSPSYGMWKRTGPLQTTHIGYHFSYDDDGTPIWIGKATSVVNWEPGFMVGHGLTIDDRQILPGEDPLDPDAGEGSEGGPFIVRRIVQ
jgi:hypothetical protein